MPGHPAEGWSSFRLSTGDGFMKGDASRKPSVRCTSLYMLFSVSLVSIGCDHGCHRVSFGIGSWFRV